QIIAVVRESISVLPLASQKISLKLHPDDAELVRSALALDEMSSSWAIVEDPLITRGGCEVDTDISHVNATVEHRLAAVIATLLGGERESDSKTAVGSLETFSPSMEVEPEDRALTEVVGQRAEQLPIAQNAVAEDKSL
ncbi:MAG: FliH/SctL family protein, partial [Methylobacter sp.]